MRPFLLATLAGAALSLSGAAPAPDHVLPPFKAPAHRPGADPPPPPLALVRRAPSPADYARAALREALRLPPHVARRTRFLALPRPEDAKVVSYGLNVVSRGDKVLPPPVAAGGLLLAVYVPSYAPEARDEAEWLGLWEKFRFDPKFSKIVTPDVAHQLRPPPQRVNRFKVAAGKVRKEDRVVKHFGGSIVYPDNSGRVAQDQEPGDYVLHLEFREKDCVEEVSSEEDPFSGGDAAATADAGVPELYALKELLGTEAPVVYAPYFLHRALRTIEGQKVYKTVYGGLYYEFAGVRESKDPGVTDLDLFFKDVGLEGGDRLFERLRSDQRAALIRSKVTGKPRVVVAYTVPTARPGEASGFGSLTGDVFDESVDVGDVGYLNLLTFRKDGLEGIFPRRNGLLTYVLFNGQGKLARFAPQNLVSDRTSVPEPHTTNLEAAYSCLVCHGTDGSDGWKAFANDVGAIASGRLDIFDDLGVRRPSDDTVQRLVGLYGGNFTRGLAFARDSFAEATLRATGPFNDGPDEDRDPLRLVRTASRKLQEDAVAYRYDLVSPRRALLELGWEVTPGREREMLALLLPPEPHADLGGFLLEDGRLGALLNGKGVNRFEWDLAFSFAYERARDAEAAGRLNHLPPKKGKP